MSELAVDFNLGDVGKVNVVEVAQASVGLGGSVEFYGDCVGIEVVGSGEVFSGSGVDLSFSTFGGNFDFVDEQVHGFGATGAVGELEANVSGGGTGGHFYLAFSFHPSPFGFGGHFHAFGSGEFAVVELELDLEGVVLACEGVVVEFVVEFFNTFVDGDGVRGDGRGFSLGVGVVRHSTHAVGFAYGFHRGVVDVTSGANAELVGIGFRAGGRECPEALSLVVAPAIIVGEGFFQGQGYVGAGDGFNHCVAALTNGADSVNVEFEYGSCSGGHHVGECGFIKAGDGVFFGVGRFKGVCHAVGDIFGVEPAVVHTDFGSIPSESNGAVGIGYSSKVAHVAGGVFTEEEVYGSGGRIAVACVGADVPALTTCEAFGQLHKGDFLSFTGGDIFQSVVDGFNLTTCAGVVFGGVELNAVDCAGDGIAVSVS